MKNTECNPPLSLPQVSELDARGDLLLREIKVLTRKIEMTSRLIETQIKKSHLPLTHSMLEKQESMIQQRDDLVREMEIVAAQQQLSRVQFPSRPRRRMPERMRSCASGWLHPE